jgi:hypothetical protein
MQYLNLEMNAPTDSPTLKFYQIIAEIATRILTDATISEIVKHKFTLVGQSQFSKYPTPAEIQSIFTAKLNALNENWLYETAWSAYKAKYPQNPIPAQVKMFNPIKMMIFESDFAVRCLQIVQNTYYVAHQLASFH